MPRRLVAVLVAALLAAQPAVACEVPGSVALSKFDQDRMADFWRSRSQGLAQAMIAKSYNDLVDVHALFAEGDSFIDAMPDGDYRCRTLKLGGAISPLTVYEFFACRVSDGGTRIEKLTGSQRFSGTLTPAGIAVFYHGALHYGDEQPIAYGADAERDQVGCIYGINGSNSYRLELPSPQFESQHDVIELIPAD